MQMLCGLALLEVLSLLLFAGILVQQQRGEIHLRAVVRLEHQAASMAVQAKEALQRNRPDEISLSVRMMGLGPSVNKVRVTDQKGQLLFVNEGDPADAKLTLVEHQQISKIKGGDAIFFAAEHGLWEGVAPITTQGKIYGYAWITSDKGWDNQQLYSILKSTIIFGIIWILASLLLAGLLARSITRPLALLHRGTKALMHSIEGEAQFPLPITVKNEFGDLIEAFNRMVASIEEQRSGLSDTLSLLDSMLAYAPIGLAFFDRRCRFVRVNRIFADATGIPLSRHLGRTLTEVIPAQVAQFLEQTIEEVFESDTPVRDLEVTGQMEPGGRAWTWIASAYPIHTTPESVRWVGLIVLDASDRKRSEEALRKTEKLAATGRLAASIAHEINNPLEAITNLLYLLSTHPELDDTARSYVDMAVHELRRISEITQQTLRFYRQSTLPANASCAELLDSVLSLHQVRLRNRGIQVEKKYDPDTELYCFAGELRQVFANLIGNAIDAMQEGGRLALRARRSREWKGAGRSGIRIQVADTGEGMMPEVQLHIFEPFFTTKEAIGTGLGLWVSSEIVAKHKGTIRVRSRAARLGGGHGTIFELFFPHETELPTSPEAEPRHVVASEGVSVHD
ncbi:sensor histidine kinase [Acidicapsa dinghuensis]|uniref:histidine kinase n=1 Tax=Acidicapsa dinghuensis TaxID=2218256 RepID=A0ABW1EKY7_9BACT|nr:ATP-binding protein [Acidicapsa dinghuensis]